MNNINNTLSDLNETNEAPEINDTISILKDSLQKELALYKNTVKSKNDKHSTNIKKDTLTQKEKIEKYFRQVKQNSKLNLSGFSNTSSINASQMKQSPMNNKKEGNFIIYETFKNLMNKKTSTARLSSNVLTLDPDKNMIKKDETFSHLQYQDNIAVEDPEEMHNNFNEVEQISIMNDINNLKIEQSNNFNVNRNITTELVSTFSMITEPTTQTNKKKDKASFYKAEYFNLKRKISNIKKKYIKEKKIAEMLNLKLFYETHKEENDMNENKKINNILIAQIKENAETFAQIENDLKQKEKIINEQSQVIKQQKDIIEKLLKEINNNHTLNTIGNDNILEKTDPEIEEIFNSKSIL